MQGYTQVTVTLACWDGTDHDRIVARSESFFGCQPLDKFYQLSPHDAVNRRLPVRYRKSRAWRLAPELGPSVLGQQVHGNVHPSLAFHETRSPNSIGLSAYQG